MSRSPLEDAGYLMLWIGCGLMLIWPNFRFSPFVGGNILLTDMFTNRRREERVEQGEEPDFRMMVDHLLYRAYPIWVRILMVSITVLIVSIAVLVYVGRVPAWALVMAVAADLLVHFSLKKLYSGSAGESI